MDLSSSVVVGILIDLWFGARAFFYSEAALRFSKQQVNDSRMAFKLVQTPGA